MRAARRTEEKAFAEAEEIADGRAREVEAEKRKRAVRRKQEMVKAKKRPGKKVKTT